MTELQSQNHEDVLERSVRGLRNVAVPEGPSDELLTRTLAALAGADQTPSEINPRRITMRGIVKLAIAACLVLAIGSLMWTSPNWGAHVAFGEVIEKVQQARSVRFKSTVTPPAQPGKPAPPKVTLTTTIRGSVMRQEMSGMVMLTDSSTGQWMTLDPIHKVATRMQVTTKVPQPTTSINPIEQFSHAVAKDAKPLGKQVFDGRELEGFSMETPVMTTSTWVDPKTQLPVRMEVTMHTPIMPTSTMEMTHFEWDVPLDDAAMSLLTPAGYTERSMGTIDTSPATEAELVNSLRALAELNGGKFPNEFNIAVVHGLGESTGHSLRRDMESPDKTVQAAAAAKLTAIMRGFTFVQSTASGSDWHYAGKSAALNEPDRAVMWYKPAGSPVYHVINAELTVRDVSEKDLPTIESVRLPGAFPAPATRPSAGPTMQSSVTIIPLPPTTEPANGEGGL